MSDINDKVQQAIQAGYSPTEIADHLSQVPAYANQFKQARTAGYSDEDIIGHLGGGKASGVAPAIAGSKSDESSFDGKIVKSANDFGSAITRGIGNYYAGALRGAGSIGSTLLYPIDKAQDIIDGNGKPTLSSLITGQKPLTRNEQRRADIDAGLQSLGADPTSGAFKTGKIAAEIAGTAGAGGALASGLRAVPGVGAAAPALLDSIGSAGFKAAGATGLPAVAARVGGGAVAGGASAGLVDPKDAATGAIVGAALPAVAQIAGKGGTALGSALGGKAQTADQIAAVDAARQAGYVIPPSQAKPSVVNKILEGLSGKITTAQNASAANSPVTNSLAAKALGLAPDTQITPNLLQTIRDKAGDAYKTIGASGTITPGTAYTEALDKIAAPAKKAAEGFPNAKQSPIIDLVDSLRSDKFDADSALEKIKDLRSEADSSFSSNNATLGRAQKSAASAIESAVEDHLAQTGNTQALTDFRDARQLIAKTYNVQKALNPSTGTVDAGKLAQQLAKGKPLSGELKDAAQFAQRFPKAAQTPERMGSLPQSSPLDWAASGGIAAAAHSTPVGMLAMGARPLARKVALSSVVQNGLGSKPTSAQLTRIRDLLAQGGYLAAPNAVADQ